MLLFKNVKLTIFHQQVYFFRNFLLFLLSLFMLKMINKKLEVSVIGWVFRTSSRSIRIEIFWSSEVSFNLTQEIAQQSISDRAQDIFLTFIWSISIHDSTQKKKHHQRLFFFRIGLGRRIWLVFFFFDRFFFL